MFSSLAVSDNHVGNSSGVAAGRNDRCPKLSTTPIKRASKEIEQTSAFPRHLWSAHMTIH